MAATAAKSARPPRHGRGRGGAGEDEDVVVADPPAWSDADPHERRLRAAAVLHAGERKILQFQLAEAKARFLRLKRVVDAARSTAAASAEAAPMAPVAPHTGSK
jgi:hypothetical protein